MNASTANRWLHSFRPVAHPRRILLCFPYAGAGAALFRDWHRDAGPEDELLAVRLPGREHRFGEPCLTTVAEAVPPVLEALTERLGGRLDRPLILFGHSLGAALAYATARALIGRGHPPRLLAVSGRRAPQVTLRRTATQDLSEAEFRDKLHALGGTPPEVLASAELMELMVPLLRADFGMSDRFFEPAPAPLPIPLVAFAGTGDAEVPVEAVAEWERLAGAGFALHRLPGDHFFLNAQRRTILDALLSAA
ncbi:medium-chain acyl-[acyl-carrier-protein] hydrolase [Azospirillum agricola]|uniref:thioesterase II family protein n=1 Tax=Azospirillum agricola TaxID=1720247 RepID=UPI001AE2756A|nr:alpha/beta fold hydrolase [Azospirillum agricola]MBP2228486.1 medium-chain acyl-[acyl-carrier-protein] hydrolase [Azospirillum agricola]